MQPPAPQPVWRQPADLNLAATQQRPPGWPPAPQPRPADRPPPQIGTPPLWARLRRRNKIALAVGAAALIAAVAIVIVVGGPTSKPLTADANHPVTIGGNTQQKSVVCDNGEVTIRGNNSAVDITGHCSGVFVYGDENSVTLDGADTLGVGGFDNSITYRDRAGSPSTTAVSGISNTIKPA